MNGETGLRLEFIVLNCHCRLNFESRVGMKSFAPDPLFSPQDCVCLDCYRHITAAGPFQCIIMSIMNDHLAEEIMSKQADF
eukprot:scaffold3684_cov64-Cyclotella_meneghiniana.AAC.1